jgi:hypothetical protein
VVTVRFTPDIELGSLIQAAIISITVLGSCFGFYLSIEREIDSSHNQVILLEQRMTQNESALKDIRDDAKQAANDTRKMLEDIQKEISDIRTLVAAIPSRSR